MSPPGPSRDESLRSLYLLQAARSGRFPEAYAQTCSLVPLPYAELVAVGREVDTALTAKSYARRATLLGAIGSRLAERYLRKLYVEHTDPELLEFIRGFYIWSGAYNDRDLGHGTRADTSKLARSFGAVCALVNYAVGEGATADVATLADSGAEFVPHVFCGEGISVTDARAAIAHYTRYVPLKDWLSAYRPEPLRGAVH